MGMITVCVILIAGLTALIISGVISKLWLIAVAIVSLDLFLGVVIKLRKTAFAQKKRSTKSERAPKPIDQPVSQSTLAHVDQTFFMSGKQFEQYVAEIYASLGYKVKIVGGSGDQGIDIIATKFFKKIGIQAKCYFKPVSNKAVMEAAAGKKYYRLHQAVVVTNSIFTNSAVALAQKCNVKLINKRDLSQMVKKIHDRY